MRKYSLDKTCLQLLLASAGFYFLFAPLFGQYMDGWILLLTIVVIANLSIWPVQDCMPKMSELTGLSSDLTPLLGRVLPWTFSGIILGSVVLTFQFERMYLLADVAFISFLIFTLIYVYCACFIYHIQFDEATLVYKGLLFFGDIQLHEVKEMHKCVGLLYRIKYESKTHRGQMFFLDHSIDRDTVEGDQTSLRKFLFCYLEAQSKINENDGA